MRSTAFFFLLLSFLVGGCREKTTPELSKDILPREKFTDVLADIRLLEGAYSAKYAKVDTSVYKIESYYLTLFERHGITKEIFFESYNYYSMDQEKMLSIEDAVIAALTQRLPVSDTSSTISKDTIDVVKAD